MIPEFFLTWFIQFLYHVNPFEKILADQNPHWLPFLFGRVEFRNQQQTENGPANPRRIFLPPDLCQNLSKIIEVTATFPNPQRTMFKEILAELDSLKEAMHSLLRV